MSSWIHKSLYRGVNNHFDSVFNNADVDAFIAEYYSRRLAVEETARDSLNIVSFVTLIPKQSCKVCLEYLRLHSL